MSQDKIWWIVVPTIIGSLLLAMTIIYFTMKHRAHKYIKDRENLGPKKNIKDKDKTKWNEKK